MSEEIDIDEGRQRHHGKRVYVAFAGLAIVAALCWFGTLEWKKHLTVGGIIVEGEHILTKDEIVKLSQISLKTNMYDADLSGIAANVEKNHFVKSVAVTRDAPGIIRISVVERTPIALVVPPGGAELLSVDEEGYVLPHASSQSMFDLPVISGVDSVAGIPVGQRTTQGDVLAAIEVLDVARKVSSELYHMISEVRIRSGHDMILYSADTGIPILFGRGDAAKKLVTLDAFWKKFVAEQGAQEFRYIDVRFDGQVVVSSRPADSQTAKKAS
ncbi:MAG TPA: FtsQ-type POTRA domain-containing protein [Bacteroidota bacterium]|nr:FtsQ-type POTRA domain-containing protein [Bacteroidota bacterium]